MKSKLIKKKTQLLVLYKLLHIVLDIKFLVTNNAYDTDQEGNIKNKIK